MTAVEKSHAVEVYVASRFASSVGASVYASVAPLIAAVMFGAGAAQIGLITSTAMVTSIILRIPVANIIDRIGSERRVMVRWGVVSSLVSALVPCLWLLGVLNFWSFLGCVAASGIVSSVLSAAGHRMVTALTGEGERTRAIGLLNSAESVGDIVGQSGGGLLVGIIPPPLSLLLASLASLVGVSLLPKASDADERGDRAEEGGVAPSFSLGSTVIAVKQAVSKPFVVVTVVVGIAGSIIEPVVVLYLLNVGSVHPSLIGVAIGMGAVGGVIGGLIVGPAVQHYGFRVSFIVATACMAIGTLLLMVVAPIEGWGFVAGVVFELMTAAGGTVAIAGSMGRLQEEAKRDEVARTMAGASLALELTGLAGIGFGVIVAEMFDLRMAIIASLAVYAIVIGVSVGRQFHSPRVEK